MGRAAYAAVAVVLLVAASGCSAIGALGDGTGGGGPPDVDVAARVASLDTVEYTRVSSIERNGTTNETRTRVRADFAADPTLRAERVLAPDARAGDRTVANESASVVYDASENTVRRLPRTATTAGAGYDRAAYVERIVAAASADGERPGGVSPLPVVPAAERASAIPADAIGGFDVSYLGTRTVAGHTAHGFELTATSDAAVTLNQTLWLDSQYYFPLQTRTVYEWENRTVVAERRVTDVTFDADLPADAFAFDPPPNATVESANVSAQSFDSVDALREATTLAVPSPDVPDGYAFEHARRFEENATQIGLTYESEEGSLTVFKTDRVSNRSEGIDAGEAVTVAGHDGRFVQTSRSSLVVWSCDGREYAVLANALEKDEILAVAESVACE